VVAKEVDVMRQQASVGQARTRLDSAARLSRHAAEDNQGSVRGAISAGRLYFLDNLRVVLMVWVIAHHVGQAYGPTGGAWPIQEAARALLLRPFFTVNRSFGMSLFFLIAGYFMVMSCDARGPRAFLKSRLLRLGLPLLIFAVCMIPLQVFVLGPLMTGRPGPAWPIEVGHLWFVEHLLVFSACYALWRMARHGHAKPHPRLANPPGYLPILIFALGLAVVTTVVRTWFPIDKWVYLFGFLRVAFADVPRDLSFFIIGALAYRYQWLHTFPTQAGKVWLMVGLSLAGLWYVYDLAWADAAPIDAAALRLVYPLWEALLACGMCIGLAVLFRERFAFTGPFAKALAQSQYAAYIFHLPVVLLCQYAIIGLALPPLAKFAAATLASVPLTFLLAYSVRKPLRI
jgi:peptidoglycan/LPS O-acetylase OafA/YrhL